ncbi:MAG: transposase [Alphaproteobacteria bacterium]
MVNLRWETGGLWPKQQGNLDRIGKLAGLTAWVRGRLADRGDLTLDELCLELARLHDVKVHRSSVGRRLHRLRLSHKNLRSPANSIAPMWRIGGISGSPGVSPSWAVPWSV